MNNCIFWKVCDLFLTSWLCWSSIFEHTRTAQGFQINHFNITGSALWKYILEDYKNFEWLCNWWFMNLNSRSSQNSLPKWFLFQIKIFISKFTLFTFICDTSLFISRMFRVFTLKFYVISAKIRVIESYTFDLFFFSPTKSSIGFDISTVILEN